MKKKIYFIIVFILSVFFCASLFAQTEVDINGNGRPYSTIFDSISTGLIPSRIPYGTLYDRTYEWSGGGINTPFSPLHNLLDLLRRRRDCKKERRFILPSNVTLLIY